jgi:1,4-dihydroxy-2-naphthoate octaprenyltransferase
MLACALLEANNIRDIDGDRASGKKTLAARLGRRRAGWLYGFCISQALLSFLITRHFLVAAVLLVIYYPALRLVRGSATGRELLPLLKASARAQLMVGVVTTIVLSAHWSSL